MRQLLLDLHPIAATDHKAQDPPGGKSTVRKFEVCWLTAYLISWFGISQGHRMFESNMASPAGPEDKIAPR